MDTSELGQVEDVDGAVQLSSAEKATILHALARMQSSAESIGDKYSVKMFRALIVKIGINKIAEFKEWMLNEYSSCDLTELERCRLEAAWAAGYISGYYSKNSKGGRK